MIRSTLVEKSCTCCHKGKMEFTGKTSNTKIFKQFEHRCAYCGSVENFYDKFPHSILKTIKENSYA